MDVDATRLPGLVPSLDGDGVELTYVSDAE